MQLISDGQRGGVAGVVGAGLERRPQYRDALAGHAATSLIDGQFCDFGPLAGVDRLYRANEVAQHMYAKLLGAYGQCRDVLRQAAPAESQPGVEKLSADALVVPKGVSQ